jgi:hypothetical protein
MSAPSARGLFLATGKKGRPVAGYDLAGTLVKGEQLEREKNDFYPTPPEPTRALLAAEIDRLRQLGAIWEPAAGDGAMAREMRALGLSVFCSDLVDRGCGALIRSFYDFAEPPMQTANGSVGIFTNPPFAECSWGNGRVRWMKHALDVLGVEYMALLLNWNWPGAGGLRDFYAAHPPARVYLMRWKIDFTGQGAPPMLNAWFVWDKASTGETVLRMLDRADARQAELFGVRP